MTEERRRTSHQSEGNALNSKIRKDCSNRKDNKEELGQIHSVWEGKNAISHQRKEGEKKGGKKNCSLLRKREEGDWTTKPLAKEGGVYS